MGYRQYKQQTDNSSNQFKDNKEYIRTRAVEVSGWTNSLTTLRFKDVLLKEIERHTNMLKTCDDAMAMKFIQGKIVGFEIILAQLNSLSEAVKKILKEA